MSLKYKTVLLGLGILIFLGAAVIVTNNNSKAWGLKDYNSQKLDWQNCYGDFQCSSFKVPIDYEDMDNKNFVLKVLKHSALDKADKLGSIVVNPGGPGGSAVHYAFNAKYIVSDALLAKYDIVGFDSRGINNSEEIRCLTDAEEDNFLNADASDGKPQSIADLVAISKDFAVKCAESAGAKLGHVSTLEAAKDMEILRNLLNEDKLNFLGKSYGTYLGTLYASLFPKSVGRMVLDGAVDPSSSLREQQIAQAVGFDQALNNYLASQNKFNLADIQTLIMNSKSNPMEDSSGRKATQSLVITAIAQSLYDPNEGWRELSKLLSKAITKEDPLGIFKLADSYNSRDKSGSYYSNQNDIAIMITCLDWQEPRTVEQMGSDRDAFIKVAPVFGQFLNFAGLPCKYWKAKPQLPKTQLTKIITSPIIIIGVTEDPATPYVWSQNLAKVFPNSKLLTLRGEGHTGHNQGNKCVDSAVDSYYLTGKIRTSALICAESGN
jgi:pimeloyl-ACP methyl ester carboxylesterase